MSLLPYLMENTGVCEEERLVRFLPCLVENTGVCEDEERRERRERLEAKPIIQGAFDGEETDSFFSFVATPV